MQTSAAHLRGKEEELIEEVQTMMLNSIARGVLWYMRSSGILSKTAYATGRMLRFLEIQGLGQRRKSTRILEEHVVAVFLLSAFGVPSLLRVRVQLRIRVWVRERMMITQLSHPDTQTGCRVGMMPGKHRGSQGIRSPMRLSIRRRMMICWIRFIIIPSRLGTTTPKLNSLFKPRPRRSRSCWF
jgi:hypothetical protein